MDVLERFLDYVSYDTQSDETSTAVPSTAKQRRLGQHLAEELRRCGMMDARMDEHGYVYGTLPATRGQEHRPAVGLIAHMDTSPSASGAEVKPHIVDYVGGDIVLNEALGIILSPKAFPSLSDCVGQKLVVTDGTTLLGADDKAGVAEIIACVDTFTQHQLPHGRLCVAFTPDEEIGRGTDCFDLSCFPAEYAYTVDGGALGELEYENFNAANAGLLIKGRNVHPGEAKNKMVNALLLACELISLLPKAETPEHTEGYEGFYHVFQMQGDESAAAVNLLIRDHDRERFEQRKRFLSHTVSYLNEKYGENRFQLKMRDGYYNMKEQILPHMEIVDRAKAAFEACGVTPNVVPIRGGTDGAKLSFMGLPCPNLSTGGVNYHGIYEYVPVESLQKMTEVLTALVTGEVKHG